MHNKITAFELANSQMIQFSRYDCDRSLPNVIDGFKITQRKVLYTCLSLPQNDENKVTTLASETAKKTAYHHGDQSIVGVITGLAQSFVGTNNVNWLEPIGQFGNILSTTPAAGRYIHTKLEKDFRQYFKKEDDILLKYLDDDGDQIEPEFFIPILPSILINGTSGIGTGFASKFMNHNPDDLRKWIIQELTDPTVKRQKLTPWYKHFKGTVVRGEQDNQWYFKGVIEKVSTTTLRITELPIGKYLDDIKSILNDLMDDGTVKDYDDYSSVEHGYNIEVTVPRAVAALEIADLVDKFRLVSKDTMNLTAWLPTGKLKNFDTVENLVRYFVEFRLAKYEERRVKQIEILNADLTLQEEKIRFIRFYLEIASEFSKLKKKDLEQLLSENGFTNISKLLEIRIYNLTLEQIKKLEDEISSIRKEITKLSKTNAKAMYISELENLEI